MSGKYFPRDNDNKLAILEGYRSQRREIWEAEGEEDTNKPNNCPSSAFCSKILSMEQQFLGEKSDNLYKVRCYYQVTITFVS